MYFDPLAVGWSMRAAWDWDLPRETDVEQRQLVETAAGLGFDTLVSKNVTATMADHATAHGITTVEVVTARASESFAADHPDCLQALAPADQGIVDALRAESTDHRRRAHWKFPLILDYDLVCYEHEASVALLESRIEDALAVADGVAFDGFGFRNQYACHCDLCLHRRAEVDSVHEHLAAATVAESQLLDIGEHLYNAVKQQDADAIAMNHVWPPFNPNPRYASQLRLDYCTQTIAWFHRPHWSIDRVRFEARRHRELAGDANVFVPFIGMADAELSRRPPERLRAELEIALEYGDGHVVLSTLAVPAAHEAHADVVRELLD